MKKNIYVYEECAVISKAGAQLQVHINEQRIYNEPFSNIESLVLCERAQVTSQCVCSLMRNSIPIIYTTRSGYIIGCAYPRCTERPLLKLAQYKMADDAEICLTYAKKIVQAKILGQRNTLTGYRSAAAPRLKHMADSCLLAEDNQSLLGYEGSAAALYFESFGQCLHYMAFTARQYHPAHDPVNALLNLTYTLALYKIDSILFAQGFDTTLGFLHAAFRDRLSLSLDVLEPFRGTLDRFVLKVVNLQEIQSDEFEYGKDGCTLKKDGFSRFIALYEKEVDILPLAGEIAARLKKSFTGGEAELFELDDLFDML